MKIGGNMKIRIIGNSGSGKTTVARKLSEHFSIPVLHMDSIAFIPNSDFVLKDKYIKNRPLDGFICLIISDKLCYML